jgi:hypothetical protein
MDGTDWTTFLTNPSDVLDLYDKPPTVDSCDLFYLHIDERDTSITFGFDSRELPARPLQKWQEKEFNSIEFFVSFIKVSHLSVDGWESQGQKKIRISRNSAGEMVIRVTSDGSNLAFRAESASVTHFHPYLAAPGPCY